MDQQIKFLSNSCEQVDAHIFSGDTLYDPERFAILKDFVARWGRAIDERNIAIEEEAAEGQSVKPKMVQMTTIPKDKQESVLSSFWTMLTSCETIADNGNGNDSVLKHWVTQWYQQWNEITGDSKEPRFVTRERAKLAEEQNLPVMSLEEAKDAIQDGANLLLTQAGRFFVKAPGASPVSLSQEDGTQIMNHSSMGRSGMDSAGRITFGLQLGASFDGGQSRPRQI